MRFTITLHELEKSAHIAPEDQVEEHDVTSPPPPAKSDGDREREAFLRVGVPGL